MRSRLKVAAALIPAGNALTSVANLIPRGLGQLCHGGKEKESILLTCPEDIDRGNSFLESSTVGEWKSDLKKEAYLQRGCYRRTVPLAIQHLKSV
jgi:hypothetical protein